MLKFYGHSDDCFEIDGDKRDEIGCHDSTVHVMVGTPPNAIVVSGVYAPTGIPGAVWHFTPRMLDEDIPAPPWPIRWQQEHEYSPALIVDCPPGTPVEIVEPTSDGWKIKRK